MNKAKKIIVCGVAVFMLFFGTAATVGKKSTEPTIQGQFVTIPTNESKTENLSAEAEINVLPTTENSDKPTIESTTTKFTTNKKITTTSTKNRTTKKPTTTKIVIKTTTTKKKTTTRAESSGTYLGKFKLTAYCDCASCNGKWAGQPTASGAYPRAWHTIAVDPRVIPLGTWVKIEGLGTFKAEDTGSAIKGNRIDVYFSSHSEANRFGVQYADVYIV